MKREEMPLYGRLAAHAERRPTAFHMPGHKMGRGIGLKFDLTELEGLDNLYGSSGAIRDAQNAAAAAFGADHTRFLVNGSTGGLHAAVLYACKRAGGSGRPKLIAGRDCHKSVINGAILAGADVVFAGGGVDPGTGIPLPCGASDIAEAFLAHPDACAAVITRPTYYGACGDIRETARAVHAAGGLLIVDEAHGAHLKFSGRLPASALEAGADICVQSAHKTLPAMTQGAFLHVKGERADIAALDTILPVIGTSSPSYPIMASLDVATHMMANRGGALLDRLLDEIAHFSGELEKSDAYTVVPSDDPTRLVIDVTRTGMSGYEAASKLSGSFGIFVEMADLKNIVLICTVADRRADFRKLGKALRSTAALGSGKKFDASGAIGAMDICFRADIGKVLTPALDLNGKRVGLRDAVGMRAAAMLTPYPPGIPLVCPGEVISREAAEYIETIGGLGGRTDGLDGNGRVNVSL